MLDPPAQEDISQDPMSHMDLVHSLPIPTGLDDPMNEHRLQHLQQQPLTMPSNLSPAQQQQVQQMQQLQHQQHQQRQDHDDHTVMFDSSLVALDLENTDHQASPLQNPPNQQLHDLQELDQQYDDGGSTDGNDNNDSETKPRGSRKKKPHLQGRFSGRLATKEDEKRLTDECKLLGPLLGGQGKRGDVSRLTLAKIVRGIASGDVRRHCEERESRLKALKQKVNLWEHVGKQQLEALRTENTIMRGDLEVKNLRILELEQMLHAHDRVAIAVQAAAGGKLDVQPDLSEAHSNMVLDANGQPQANGVNGAIAMQGGVHTNILSGAPVAGLHTGMLGETSVLPGRTAVSSDMGSGGPASGKILAVSHMPLPLPTPLTANMGGGVNVVPNTPPEEGLLPKAVVASVAMSLPLVSTKDMGMTGQATHLGTQNMPMPSGGIASSGPLPSQAVQVAAQAAQAAQVQAQSLQAQAQAHAHRHAEAAAQAQSLHATAQAIAQVQAEIQQKMLSLKAQVEQLQTIQVAHHAEAEAQKLQAQAQAQAFAASEVNAAAQRCEATALAHAQAHAQKRAQAHELQYKAQSLHAQAEQMQVQVQQVQRKVEAEVAEASKASAVYGNFGVVPPIMHAAAVVPTSLPTAMQISQLPIAVGPGATYLPAGTIPAVGVSTPPNGSLPQGQLTVAPTAAQIAPQGMHTAMPTNVQGLQVVTTATALPSSSNASGQQSGQLPSQANVSVDSGPSLQVSSLPAPPLPVQPMHIDAATGLQVPMMHRDVALAAANIANAGSVSNVSMDSQMQSLHSQIAPSPLHASSQLQHAGAGSLAAGAHMPASSIQRDPSVASLPTNTPLPPIAPGMRESGGGAVPSLRDHGGGVHGGMVRSSSNNNLAATPPVVREASAHSVVSTASTPGLLVDSASTLTLKASQIANPNSMHLGDGSPLSLPALQQLRMDGPSPMNVQPLTNQGLVAQAGSMPLQPRHVEGGMQGQGGHVDVQPSAVQGQVVAMDMQPSGMLGTPMPSNTLQAQQVALQNQQNVLQAQQNALQAQQVHLEMQQNALQQQQHQQQQHHQQSAMQQNVAQQQAQMEMQQNALHQQQQQNAFAQAALQQQQQNALHQSAMQQQQQQQQQAPPQQQSQQSAVMQQATLQQQSVMQSQVVLQQQQQQQQQQNALQHSGLQQQGSISQGGMQGSVMQGMEQRMSHGMQQGGMQHSQSHMDMHQVPGMHMDGSMKTQQSMEAAGSAMLGQDAQSVGLYNHMSADAMSGHGMQMSYQGQEIAPNASLQMGPIFTGMDNIPIKTEMPEGMQITMEHDPIEQTLQSRGLQGASDMDLHSLPLDANADAILQAAANAVTTSAGQQQCSVPM